MSKLAAFLSKNAGTVVGTSVLAVAAVGVGIYLAILKPNDAVQGAVQKISLSAASAPQTTISEPFVAAAEAVIEVVEEPEKELAEEFLVVEPVSPSIDEVRSESDGLTILAGRGEPNSKVTLFVDEIEKSSVSAGNDGSFAIITFLDPSSDPKALSVVQEVGDLEIAAADIILAPQLLVAEDEKFQALPIEQAVKVDSDAVKLAEEAKTVKADVEDQVAVLVTDTASVSEVASSVKAEAYTLTPGEGSQANFSKLNLDVEEPKVDVTDGSRTEEQKVPAAKQLIPVTKETKTEVAILKSDENGVEVINRSSAPELMSNVEIDTISYSEKGDVLLSGRAQSQAASIHVYLDNTVIATLAVDTFGRWRGELPDIDAGVYTLRVDEVNVKGDVTSRVETPFKREAPEVLEAAAGNSDVLVKAITVQKGATLWAIARNRYGDGMLYVRVFEANADSIKDPDLIYPGQVFKLPG